MIQARLQINGKIRGREQITGNINGSVKNIYPELENLEINPTTQKQYLKSEKYGYNEITVNEVTSTIDKNIKPEYIKNGINILGVDGKFEGIDTSDATASANDIRYNKSAYINGEKIIGNLDEAANLSLNALKIEQFVGGNYGPTGIVEYSEKDIIIKKGTQISMSMPSSVLADVINVTSENLLVGNEVLGVQGTATSDATVTSDTIIEGEIAYAKGQKITGNIKNNGELNYIPTTESQEIPSGYTSGGQVQGDANLLPENIKKGVEIFGVVGDYGKGIPTETEYTKLSYIESTGTQYIETFAYPDRFMDIDIKYRRTSNLDYGWEAPFGCREHGYNFVFWDRANGSETTKATQFSTLNYQEWKISKSNFNIDTMLKITHDCYVLQFDGEIYQIEKNSYSTSKSTTSINLFANKNKDGSVDSPCCMRLYSCKIYYKNELYRDYIPCKDTSGVVCLYDKISKTYFYNQGTGDFIAGPELPDIAEPTVTPKAEEQIEQDYIEETIDY